jgi:hypothetical protein
VRTLMSAMAVDDDHLLTEKEYHESHRMAKELGIEITTRKISGEGFRVWRTK